MAGAFLKSDLWVNEYLTPYDIWQHGVTKVLAHRQTPFQEMYVVESGAYGKALVLDGKWQTCTGDEFLYHEPLVHVPAVCHGAPQRVLIAGGADGGALREVLKWRTVTEAVVADIDAEVISTCRELLPEIHQGAFDDPRSRIQVGDAFDLISSSRGEWDLILADLTDPIEEGPAFKLFTKEFFECCRRALRPGGYFVNQAGSMSPPLCGSLCRVAKTIQSVFGHAMVVSVNVPTYGSPWGFVLASDGPIQARPDPKNIDSLLSRQVSGSLRMFDGQAYLGLLQSPKYIRDAIAAETQIYTLTSPPHGFGRGTMEHTTVESDVARTEQVFDV